MHGSNHLTFCLTVLHLFLSSIALAQESGPPPIFSLGDIEIITIKGERTSNWSTPFQATITDEQMRLFERNDVASALSLLPGVTVQNIGARSEKLVYIRGFNSRQIPLFIDGVPVYVPYDGNFDLSRLLTFDVAQIDVGKGFSSVLYGANTLGGSINVISKRPQKGMRANLRNGFHFDDHGSTPNNQHALSLENASNNWYLQGNLSWSEQKFFTLPSHYNPTVAEIGGRRNNSANEDRKLSLKLGYTPNATDEYALSWQRQEGEKNTPPYAGTDTSYRARYWQWPEYDKESVYFISRTALNAHEYIRVRIYHDTFYNLLRSFDDSSYSKQSRPYAFNSTYDDYSKGASVELGSSRIADHTLRASMQYKRDVHRERDGITPVQKMNDIVLSVGLEDIWRLSPRTSLIAGFGWDRQKGQRADELQGTRLFPFEVATADAWNTQAALTYSINERWDAHASISRRTRFPTIKDRYSYRMGTAIPNPGLKPEYAINVETGITGNIAIASGQPMQVSTTIFHSQVEDAIESTTIAPALCTSTPCSQLRNIGQQQNSGVELALTTMLSATVEVHSHYTYLERENESNPQILPLDTPRHKLFAYLQFTPIPSLDFVLSSQYESKRFSTSDGTRETRPFATADLKAVWHLNQHLQLETGGRNLSDELYAFEEGFPEAGRTWFFNIDLSL